MNDITDEDVKHEMVEGIFTCRGHNKENMKCCVITGRMLDPERRLGNNVSFRKYILRTAESILEESSMNRQSAEGGETDQVCIIYDRRGLEFENIDPNLYQFCKKLTEELQYWYGKRLGVIYILHTNMMYWLLYTVFVMPLLAVMGVGSKFVVVETPAELLQYFDEDQLFLLEHIENESNWERYQKHHPEEVAVQAAAAAANGGIDDTAAAAAANTGDVVTAAPGGVPSSSGVK